MQLAKMPAGCAHGCDALVFATDVTEGPAPGDVLSVDEREHAGEGRAEESRQLTLRRRASVKAVLASCLSCDPRPTSRVSSPLAPLALDRPFRRWPGREDQHFLLPPLFWGSASWRRPPTVRFRVDLNIRTRVPGPARGIRAVSFPSRASRAGAVAGRFTARIRVSGVAAEGETPDRQGPLASARSTP